MVRASSQFVLGVDLGQTKDYTALAIVQRVLPELTAPSSEEKSDEQAALESKPTYHLRYLERTPLGTPYPAIVTQTLALLRTPPLSHSSPLVVDKTGVGSAVVDMFNAAGLPTRAVTITGGDVVSKEGLHYKVPKRDLVSQLLTLYQTRRLKTAEGLPLFPVMLNELMNFQQTVNLTTGHDSYEAWRESVHDDLVLAVALATWYAATQLTIPMSPETARGFLALTVGGGVKVGGKSAPPISPFSLRNYRT